MNNDGAAPLVADEVHEQCPRLLINREKVGMADSWSTSGFLFDNDKRNYRFVVPSLEHFAVAQTQSREGLTSNCSAPPNLHRPTDWRLISCLLARDALYLGDADDGVTQLCSMLGWTQELQALVDAA